MAKNAISVSVRRLFGMSATNPNNVPTPYVVAVAGLNDEDIGYDRYRYELHARRGWCRSQCRGAHDIGSLCDEVGRLVGRRFSFEEADDAVRFKESFVTKLARR